MFEKISLAKHLLYDPIGLALNKYQTEAESTDYEACTFKLNAKTIIHRTAKITPTKIGQFVTIWKRNKDGITVPFDLNDDFDFIIITVQTAQNLGQFIFSKAILQEKGIISGNGKDGKRGIRVYPSWDIAVNKQAKQTQEWQLKYFINLTSESDLDTDLIQRSFTE